MINALLVVLLAVMLVFCAGWVVQWIRRNGIGFGTAVIAACVLYYQLIPLVFYLFPTCRDGQNVYNIALASLSGDALLEAMLQASGLVLLLIFAYTLRVRQGRLVACPVPVARESADTGAAAGGHKRMGRMALAADFFFLLGVAAMLLCIAGAGGIRKYLSLGALTRGIGKDVTQGISRAYLPAITLSSVILIPPFLYRYVCQCRGKHARGRRICFFASFLTALLYLVYNQGRAPLMIFLLPFFLDSRHARKIGTTGLLALFVLCCLLLERLSSLFNYLSYGRWYDQYDDNLIRTLLREFTYPFSSFALRGELLERMGMRWGSDLVEWPAVVLPSFVMECLGVDKRQIVTIGEELTEAFSTLTGMTRQGGIPSDLFFFLYAQYGAVSLAGGVLLLGVFLSRCDRRFLGLRDNRAADILILRAAMIGMSCVNHFDVAVIVRTRFDLLVLLLVLHRLSRRRHADQT